MQNTIKYLRKREWNSSNGQCGECWGSAPNTGWWTKYVGHERKCPLAKLLTELGEKVVYKKLNPERVTQWKYNKQGILVGVRANENKQDMGQKKTRMEGTV